MPHGLKLFEGTLGDPKEGMISLPHKSAYNF